MADGEDCVLTVRPPAIGRLTAYVPPHRQVGEHRSALLLSPVAMRQTHSLLPTGQLAHNSRPSSIAFLFLTAALAPGFKPPCSLEAS
jgi:hypothetical protein